MGRSPRPPAAPSQRHGARGVIDSDNEQTRGVVFANGRNASEPTERSRIVRGARLWAFCFLDCRWMRLDLFCWSVVVVGCLVESFERPGRFVVGPDVLVKPRWPAAQETPRFHATTAAPAYSGFRAAEITLLWLCSNMTTTLGQHRFPKREGAMERPTKLGTFHDVSRQSSRTRKLQLVQPCLVAPFQSR
jgi:hypothetical protein